MDQINTKILRQFKAKGLTINEAIGVDAPMVKSASDPVSAMMNSKPREKNPKVNSIKTASYLNSAET